MLVPLCASVCVCGTDLGGHVGFDELLGRHLHAVALPVGTREQVHVPHVRLSVAARGLCASPWPLG
jgi:hypothetical protein